MEPEGSPPQTDESLGTQFPALQQISAWSISAPELEAVWHSPGMGNVPIWFRRNKIRTVGDLLDMTPDDFLVWYYFGAAKQAVVMAALGRVAAVASVVSESGESESPATPTAAVPDTDVELLAQWASFSRGATTFGGLEVSLRDAMPPDVAEALDRVRARELPDLTTPSPLELLQEWIDTLDERERDILVGRLLRLGRRRISLDELGQQHGVTRERVRQVETKILAQLRSLLGTDAFRSVRWAMFQLTEGLGSFAPDSEVPIGEAPSAEDDEFRLLLQAAGYEHDEDHAAIRLASFRLPKADALPLLDEGPVVDEPALRQQLVDDGVRQQHLDFAIAAISGTHRVDGTLVLWPRNMQAKGVAVLTVRGRPMTTDEVADVIDEDFNRCGFRDRIFHEPRAMRSGRSHVALRRWGLPEYGGIVPAMVDRLSAGPHDLDELARELAESFGVSEKSVRMYSVAPVFRFVGSSVELRPDDDPYVPKNQPWKVPGLYLADDHQVVWHVAVDKDILRGSGRVAPNEVAIHLGLTPPSTITLKNDAKDVVLSWLETSHVGANIGSLRALAEVCGAGEGDLLRLVFDADSRTLSGEVVAPLPEGLGTTASLAHLTGLPAAKVKTLEALATAIGTSPQDVLEALSQRGDDQVAELAAACA